jgi:hypothetical protein
MGFEKAELRAELFNEVGCDVEDALEKAREERAGLAGAKRGLVSAVSFIDQLYAVAAKEVEEGKLEEATLPAVKRYILRASEIVRNLATSSEVQMHVASGKVQALEVQMRTIKKKHENERSHAKALSEGEDALQRAIAEKNAEESGRLSRIPGQHPGPSLRARRSAEPKKAPRKEH